MTDAEWCKREAAWCRRHEHLAEAERYERIANTLERKPDDVLLSEARERFLDTMGETVPDVATKDYADAFYELAAMMGLGASCNSPKVVWERDMKPRLIEAIGRAGGEG